MFPRLINEKGEHDGNISKFFYQKQLLNSSCGQPLIQVKASFFASKSTLGNDFSQKIPFSLNHPQLGLVNKSTKLV
jgi:hypothetical protein